MVSRGDWNDGIPRAAPGQDALVSAYSRAMRLKRLFRQGWLKRGVAESVCETVADHSFGVALLVLLVPGRPDVDRARALEMAVVHELGECYAGDITPVDGVDAGEKHRLEEASLLRVLDGHPERDRLAALWREFEDGRTPEARLVRQLDRLEMGFQAASYRSEGSAGMEEFLESARRSVGDPGLRRSLERAAEASEPLRGALPVTLGGEFSAPR